MRQKLVILAAACAVAIPSFSAVSPVTTLWKGGDVGILYEGAGYGTIDFVTVPKEDIRASTRP